MCGECIAAIRPISGFTCDVCGERLSGPVRAAELQLCGVCQESRPSFAKATAFGAYEGELRELIHLFKYDRVMTAVGLLGRMLAGAIKKLSLADRPLLIVPVPLHSSKRRQRGFNQSEELARAALKHLALPDIQLASKLLVRERATVSQIGLTRPQRAENIRGAFRVVHPSRVEGQRVLLVDDVLTTGTTASECARVLRKAGAEAVFVATVARTRKEAEISRNEPTVESETQVL